MSSIDLEWKPCSSKSSAALRTISARRSVPTALGPGRPGSCPSLTIDKARPSLPAVYDSDTVWEAYRPTSRSNLPHMSRDALIVEALRTPIGRGHPEKGAFRDVHPNVLLGSVYRAVIE